MIETIAHQLLGRFRLCASKTSIGVIVIGAGELLFCDEYKSDGMVAVPCCCVCAKPSMRVDTIGMQCEVAVPDSDEKAQGSLVLRFAVCNDAACIVRLTRWRQLVLGVAEGDEAETEKPS